MKPSPLYAYHFSLLLIFSIVTGGLVGYWGGEAVIYLKPLGDLFLNLILTAIIPLVFFCVASSVTKFKTPAFFKKTFLKALGLFIVLGSAASLFMLLLVLYFVPTADLPFPQAGKVSPAPLNLINALPSLLSVSHFGQLFSNEHLLALILFAILTGIALQQTDHEGTFIRLFHQAEAVFLQLFTLLMKGAPLGFFAYFAVMVHNLGPQFLSHYAYSTILYYAGSLFYFLVVFSLIIIAAGGKSLLVLFWRNILLPASTAIGTCSSIAAIPANCEALKRMQVPAALAETLIPIGTLLHKQGSIMGGILKIAFLYALFHLPFTALPTLIAAIGISLLVGTVMGAIPSGGLLGELFILHVYGFDPSCLFMIAAISVLIDPPATLLNVTGNTLAVLLLGRGGRRDFL